MHHRRTLDLAPLRLELRRGILFLCALLLAQMIGG